MTMSNLNEAVFASSEIVAAYAKMDGLHRCEQHLFAKYLRPGATILDIGVGAGRTAPYLAPAAASYIGIDYSEPMIDAARRRFPASDFRWGDAADLSGFENERFDLVLFSFNGMSSIPSDESRRRALQEVARVLKPGGNFIFSVSNAEFLIFLPELREATLKQRIWRCVISATKTLGLLWRQLRSGVFFRGEGYLPVPVHKGMRLYAATPAIISAEAAAAGLSVVEKVDYDCYFDCSRYAVGSWCYVAEKP
ncbi:class I SAM-dependent methyltransferase [Methylocystis bryophila]|uniref:Methyltransferase domain-containing protein n=1 Tax=Methylocystis bryophila TaxID=655015 RepID=A0A1W6MUC1_9HYPH|nr:class I SAM-dependent methyltransferase [Methylocystis bryophila]ARN81210.1 hypothetical protein B1812_09090 [Methylocystis bryophila]BDV37156.1 hypothetical protein DSM21852_04090 [Methylocystis bryophila]